MVILSRTWLSSSSRFGTSRGRRGGCILTAGKVGAPLLCSRRVQRCRDDRIGFRSGWVEGVEAEIQIPDSRVGRRDPSWNSDCPKFRITCMIWSVHRLVLISLDHAPLYCSRKRALHQLQKQRGLSKRRPTARDRNIVSNDNSNIKRYKNMMVEGLMKIFIHRILV